MRYFIGGGIPVTNALLERRSNRILQALITLSLTTGLIPWSVPCYSKLSSRVILTLKSVVSLFGVVLVGSISLEEAHMANLASYSESNSRRLGKFRATYPFHPQQV